MTRRPFVLLEFLIALLLVGMLSVYLIQSPVRALKHELNLLVDLEAKRLMLLEAMKVREALPQLSLSSEKETKWIPVSPEPKVVLETKRRPIEKKIPIEYRAWLKREKRDSKGILYTCIRVEVRLKNQPQYQALAYDFFLKQS